MNEQQQVRLLACLKLVEDAAARAPLSRQDHINVQAAVMQLKAFLEQTKITEDKKKTP